MYDPSIIAPLLILPGIVSNQMLPASRARRLLHLLSVTTLAMAALLVTISWRHLSPSPVPQLVADILEVVLLLSLFALVLGIGLLRFITDYRAATAERRVRETPP